MRTTSRSRRTFNTTSFLLVLLLPICVLLVIAHLAGTSGRSTPALASADSTSTPAPDCAPSWQIALSPDPSSVSFLNGITAISDNDVWAVGQFGHGTYGATLAEHWDEANWSVVSTPDVVTGTNSSNVLSGVAAASATDVWAVGQISGNTNPPHATLIEHWDGSQWSVVTSPNPDPTEDALTAVAAVSVDDVWAVGYTGVGTLTEHWDGSQWSTVPSPSPDGYSTPLQGVTAISANNIWAVGYSGVRSIIVHWDGSQWSIITSPPPPAGGSVLWGVSGTSAADVWAVGSGGGAVIVHWNGSQWSAVPSPSPGSYATLVGVTAVSANDAWAVGYDSTGTLTERWDGSQWSVVPSPNPDVNSFLQAVAALSASDVWASGYWGATFVQTLIEHYANPCITPSQSPTTSPIVSPTATSPAGTTATATPGRTGTPAMATATPFATCTIAFSDVPPGSTFYPFIHCLACLGIINGYPDGTFRPGNNVTRGRLSKIVSNSARFSDNQTTQLFQDVPVGSTFFQFIGRLASRGYISGYPCGDPEEPCQPGNLPYFRPNANATRGQISKIDSNAAGFNDVPSGQQFQDVPVGSTYYTYTYRLVTRSVMSGYPCGGAGEPCIPPASLPYFRPNNNATRGEISKIGANTFFSDCTPPGRP